MALSPEEDPQTGDLPPSLRVLKWLVIALTLSMIGAVITVVWLLVTRMPQVLRQGPDVPDAIQLPPGETAGAVTFGTGWTAVVTQSGRLLVFGTDGRLRQEVTIAP